MFFLSLKNKQKFILTAVFIFTIAVGFGFSNIEKANAGYCVFTELSNDQWGTTTMIQMFEETTQDKCVDGTTCPNKTYDKHCLYTENKSEVSDLQSQLKAEVDSSGVKTNATGKITNSNTVCNNVGFNPITWFNCLMLIILQFLAMLLQAVSYLFEQVVKPSVFNTVVGTNATIYTTWAMVRDTLNIAFILVLLFSAFCTVFQIEKYGYKKILLTLVIMALLVNFSFPIARVIIDFSNVIMYYFINNLGIGTKAASIFPTIAEDSAIANIIATGDASANASSSLLLASVVFMFILVVTVFVITILLLIRIVVLAFLVIFSSIAFVGSIVPFLSTHASKWWDNLFKYSFFGPIMVFMIYVSLQMMASVRSIGSGTTDTIASMALFSLPIVILLAGLMVAKNMSIMGAAAITGSATKFLTWSGKTLTGYRAAKWTVKAGAKKLDRDVLQKAYLSPRAWSRAWKKHTEEKEADKMGHGEAKARDVLEKVFNRGRKGKHFYEDQKEAELVAKYKKEQEAVSNQDVYCLNQIKKLQGRKDKESRLRTEAYLMTMSDQKDLNEFMKLQDLDVEPYALKRKLTETLAATGMDEEDIAKTLFHIGNNSFAQGDYSKGGMAGMDENGNWKIHTDKEQKDWVLGKIKNVDVQKLMINMHPGSVITEKGKLKEGESPDLRGNAIGVHDIGREVFRYLNEIGAPHMNRPRGDTQTKWYSIIDQWEGDFPKVAEKLREHTGRKGEKSKPENQPAPAQPAPAQPEIKIETSGHTYNARPGSKMTF